MLSYNSNGYLLTKLSSGPQYDSYKLTAFVRIIDNLNSATDFYLPNPIVVMPDDVYTAQIARDIINNNSSSSYYQSITSNIVKETSQTINSLMSSINVMASSLSSSVNSSNSSNSSDYISQVASSVNSSIHSTISILFISFNLSVLSLQVQAHRAKRNSDCKSS